MERDHIETDKQENTGNELPEPALDDFHTVAETQQATDSGADYDQIALLGFRIGSFGFLLEAKIFCEIVDQFKVNPLPNVPSWLSGVLNLRGNIVPVVDFHGLAGEKANAKNRHLLAIDRGRKTVAFWIDGYPHMINADLPYTDTPSGLPDTLAAAVTAYRLQDQHIWCDISLDRLFKVLGHHAVPAGV